MMARMLVALSRVLLASGALCGGVVGAEAQSPPVPAPPPDRREFPLNCRGGGDLVFDTLIVIADSDLVRLSLTFAASPTASGPEGQGLQPGSCAWVDRPLNDAEPRRIQFSIGTADSAPRLTVGDSGMYWGFLAANADSGYIRGVGYRHWHASSPPQPHTLPEPAAPAPAAASRRGFPLPFDVRYLPVFALVMGAVIGLPSTVAIGRWSGWRGLAERYPDRNTGRGRSFRSGQLVMRMTVYRMGVRYTMDASHLHIAMWALARLGHSPLSIPWPEIEARSDAWPWFPLKGAPMVRLTLAARPDLRILVKVRDAERIAEGSGGRLTVRDTGSRPMAAQR